MNRVRGGYILITPVRNEATTIERTISSVASQTHPPAEWVIVDDGSTDATPSIVGAHMEDLPYLRYVRRQDRGHDAVGGGVVEAFNAGFRVLECTSATYLGKLDADIELGPDYFHRLVALMDAEPKLGIASGQNYLLSADGTLELEKHARFHPVGGARLYRREVLDAIGGLLPSPGWDTLDLVRARMNGYLTRTLDDLHVHHLRPMGTRGELREGVLRLGRISYLLGYHPLYFAARVVSYAMRQPMPRRGWWLLLGYLKAALIAEPRLSTPEEMRWLRRFQWQRLTACSSD